MEEVNVAFIQMFFKNAISKVVKWIKSNKKEFYILLFILLIGAFLRLYKISEYMTFLGDEGRDAIIVRRLLVYFDPILIGPGTSIGNMYLGPMYYYLMAPFLFLANYSPVGPSVMVALFSVATIFMIWYIARVWFGKEASRIASLLYALSPVVIIYSRSSWNPNIMPFFALLTIISLWKVWNDGSYKWLMATGLSFAFVLQSHYLGLLLFPVILIFWLLKYWNLVRNSSTQIGNLRKYSFLGLIIFALLMSPLLIFDIRHNWMNFKAIKAFFTQRETTVSIKPWKSLPNIYPIIRDNVATRIVSGGNSYTGKISVYFIISTFVLYLAVICFKLRKIIYKSDYKDNFNKGFFLLAVWLSVGIVGMGLYKQHIYDHYFGFLFPAFFLFVGGVCQKIYDLHFNGLKIIITAWIIVIAGSCLLNTPIKYVPNFQMQRAVEVANSIRKDAGNDRFNLAVIAQQNYEDGYQYFLEKDNADVVDIDAQHLDATVGASLYVVCEIPVENCDPTHSPKAEIANFGWSKIAKMWGVSGVTVYKLIHTN